MHCLADPSGEIVVTDIHGERRPVAVDERDHSARPQRPCHLEHGSLRISQPLQGPLAPRHVEVVIRFVEREGIADGETHVTPCGTRPVLGDGDHLCRGIDADDLAIVAKVVGERERSITQTAAHVQKPLAAIET
jgi:hypothetical protein